MRSIIRVARKKRRCARKYLYFDCGNCNLFGWSDVIGKFRYWFSFCCELFGGEVKQTSALPKTKIIFVISNACDSFLWCKPTLNLISLARGDDFIKMDNNHLFVEWRPNVLFAWHRIEQNSMQSCIHHSFSFSFSLFVLLQRVTFFLMLCLGHDKKAIFLQDSPLRCRIGGSHAPCSNVWS